MKNVMLELLVCFFRTCVLPDKLLPYISSDFVYLYRTIVHIYIKITIKMFVLLLCTFNYPEKII